MDAGISAAKLNKSIHNIQSVASIRCSIITCFQIVSSACIYWLKALLDEGVYAANLDAAKLRASIGCRHILASFGNSIIPYI